MTGNSRIADFGLILNSTGMVRAIFAVPCPVLFFSVRGYQAGMLKRSQKNIFNKFCVVVAIFLKVRVGYDKVSGNFG